MEIIILALVVISVGLSSAALVGVLAVYSKLE